MKNRTQKKFASFTCALLACVMFFVTACHTTKKDNNSSSSDYSTLSESNESASSYDETSSYTSTTSSQPNDNVFKDYEINDTENFVYNLIYSDLKKQYDTFTGYITLQSNDKSEKSIEVYGIAYIDYEEGYIDESGKTYFSAGFIRFPNEPIIEPENITKGLEIIPLEKKYDENFSYIYTYTTKDVYFHCIIDNKYVKYGIENDAIQYVEEPFVEGMDVDTSTRGNIFSYDLNDYVYIVEEKDYVPVSGVSLLGEADYKYIMDEVNRVLRTQESNLTYSEIKSYLYHSQEALYSYLLGLQEETFMGFPTSSLVEAVRDLDPMQHLQIIVDEDGTTTIKIIEVTKLPTLLEKIATSLVCAFGVVGGIVCDALGIPIIGNAIIGAAFEFFSQVVIDNTPVSDIQWSQIAIATVSGAISGGVSGAFKNIAAKGVCKFIMKEVSEIICDSLIDGSEALANSLIAGYTFEEACEKFGEGILAALIINSGAKIATTIIKEETILIKRKTTFSLSILDGKQLKKLSDVAKENFISELQEKAMEIFAKKYMECSIIKTNTSPYAKSLKISNYAGSITKEQLHNAINIMKSINYSSTLSAQIDSNGNNHFDITRNPGLGKEDFDSAFINSNRETFVYSLVRDFKACQVYLKDVTKYINKEYTRYTFFVKDSLSLEGLLLSDHTTITKSYRVLIDAYDNGNTIIFDAYPEFKLADFAN